MATRLVWAPAITSASRVRTDVSRPRPSGIRERRYRRCPTITMATRAPADTRSAPSRYRSDDYSRGLCRRGLAIISQTEGGAERDARPLFIFIQPSGL